MCAIVLSTGNRNKRIAREMVKTEIVNDEEPTASFETNIKEEKTSVLTFNSDELMTLITS